jgi:hypothetical protein
MTLLKCLRVLPAVLGVTAALAAVGTSLFGDFRPGANPPKSPDLAERPDGARLVEELAATKFAKLPTLSYQLRSGDVLFAWQIAPAVEAPAPRTRRPARPASRSSRRGRSSPPSPARWERRTASPSGR